MLYAVLPNGKVSHLIQTVNDFDKTFCGRWTGTMDGGLFEDFTSTGIKFSKVPGLPVCKTCKRNTQCPS